MSHQRPSPEALEKYAAGFNRSLTLRHFGATLSFPSQTLVRVTVPIKAEHRGGMGSDAVNGGIIAAIFDLVIGWSAAVGALVLALL